MSFGLPSATSERRSVTFNLPRLITINNRWHITKLLSNPARFLQVDDSLTDWEIDREREGGREGGRENVLNSKGGADADKQPETSSAQCELTWSKLCEQTN